jgi:hypothetical protein
MLKGGVKIPLKKIKESIVIELKQINRQKK